MSSLLVKPVRLSVFGTVLFVLFPCFADVPVDHRAGAVQSVAVGTASSDGGVQSGLELRPKAAGAKLLTLEDRLYEGFRSIGLTDRALGVLAEQISSEQILTPASIDQILNNLEKTQQLISRSQADGLRALTSEEFHGLDAKAAAGIFTKAAADFLKAKKITGADQVVPSEGDRQSNEIERLLKQLLSNKQADDLRRTEKKQRSDEEDLLKALVLKELLGERDSNKSRSQSGNPFSSSTSQPRQQPAPASALDLLLGHDREPADRRRPRRDRDRRPGDDDDRYRSSKSKSEQDKPKDVPKEEPPPAWTAPSSYKKKELDKDSLLDEPTDEDNQSDKASKDDAGGLVDGDTTSKPFDLGARVPLEPIPRGMSEGPSVPGLQAGAGFATGGSGGSSGGLGGDTVLGSAPSSGSSIFDGDFLPSFGQSDFSGQFGPGGRYTFSRPVGYLNSSGGGYVDSGQDSAGLSNRDDASTLYKNYTFGVADPAKRRPRSAIEHAGTWGRYLCSQGNALTPELCQNAELR